MTKVEHVKLLTICCWMSLWYEDQGNVLFPTKTVTVYNVLELCSSFWKLYQLGIDPSVA